ncbi:hypothetical protein Q0F99_09620 [Rathayibacter oskolensis]|uniref:hypothetical protein n=1 Tax=Rathayibacter oskolensis TaxID=1891671 RepID=UPI00265E29BB|nr:hypothetical protein [Rathayibacter oskolensis]WKK73070.1 hypothetical protein Q0F99_09620 [Rathayibacter oskolensis]
MSLEKWLVQAGESKVVDLDVVRSVKIALVGGQIDVIAHDEPTARVEVHSVNGRALKISMDGDRLEIDHIQLRWDTIVDVVKDSAAAATAPTSASSCPAASSSSSTPCRPTGSSRACTATPASPRSAATSSSTGCTATSR